MQKILFFIAFSVTFTLTAQKSPTGAMPISSPFGGGWKEATRAVVIGISDYRDPLIPDLRFADRDAEAFASWLKSPAGGSVPDENILLHTNAAATNAQMILSLNWLIEESKVGDRAFIYFSGHGDVERVTKYNNGYLLGSDSPPAVYGAGAFAVNYLKDIISTLSENDVQVFLITDACRAGKLAGSNDNGTRVTATRMTQQFANEIKILSCQPDEFSIEGEQWGGGRGCFSWHLENALYGFADHDNDVEINLLELSRYLQDKVSVETAPDIQIPMVQGPPKERIAYVDATAYATRKEAIKNQKTQFLPIDNRGMEEIILTEADTTIQKIYAQFLAAIDSNHLMAPAGSSANDYYEILMANADIKKLHGTVKRKFVVALMDEGQTILNKVLKTDPEVLDNIWANRVHYDHLPAYFERAAEILGENHFVWRDLKAKEYHFRAMTFRKENYPDSSAEWRTGEKIRWLEKSLEYDSTAAVTFYQLGVTLRGSSEEIKYITKAASIAPNWALIYFNFQYFIKDPVKQIEYYKKSIALDSNFLSPYNWIAWPYERLGQPDSATYWRKNYVEKITQKLGQDSSSIKAYECNDVGNALWRLRDYQRAKEFLLLGEKISQGKMPPIYANLSCVLTDMLEFENAIAACKKMLEIRELRDFFGSPGDEYFYFLNDTTSALAAWSLAGDEGRYPQIRARLTMGDAERALYLAQKNAKNDHQLYFLAGEAALTLGMLDSAEIYYRRIIESSNSFLITKAISHNRLGQMDSAQALIDTASGWWENYNWGQFYLATYYAQTEQELLSIHCLEKAISLGWQPNPLSWVTGTLCDPLLDPVRETEGFKALVRQHFPKYYDIATRIPGKQSKN